MKNYDHRKIEKKWQKEWERKKIYKTLDSSKKPKYYVLDMFPYLSGEGLHVGHPKGYIATDVISRMKRMQGANVMHPMGFDAFGLPAENYAIKTKTNPAVSVPKNVVRFKKQLKILGFDYDWSREINTTDPKFYKWTQWIFLKLFEKGLAYESYEPINWCPSCKTGLANEDVEDGKCERCDSVVEQKPMRQWVLRITDYAERLLKDLDLLDWPESIKESQKNWIGKSEGSEIEFFIKKDGAFGNKKVLIGTRNTAKISMIKACFDGVSGIDFVSLNDIPPLDDSDLKEGNDCLKNARMKSEYYFKKTGIPTISTDHIFWIKKWPKNEGIIHHIRELANSKTKATDEEVINFVLKFLNSVGGKSNAHFIYAISYTDQNGTHTAKGIPHEYILQTKRSKDFWPGYPIETLLIDSETGIFKAEQENNVRYKKVAELFKRDFVSKILREDKIKVFTTRADTIFGATYVVLAPEHELINKLKVQILNWSDVEKYIKLVKAKTNIERTAENKIKTGVELKGVCAINPANGEEIPVWIADYVLASYGTGAVIAVPAHDERDFEFAKKYNLPINIVILEKITEVKYNQIVDYKDDLLKYYLQDIRNVKVAEEQALKWLDNHGAIIWDGILINSDQFNGLNSEQARREITEFVGGKMVTKYKLRDWVFSRQRYWGEPIPVLHDGDKIVPVKEKDLPVILPKVKSYEPTGTGESPLANIPNWVNVKVGKGRNEKIMKRETNTMPQWAGSSWYYLRYMDPKNNKVLVDKKKEKYWNQIDFYVGGAEHATRHLIYARFWHKFLYDIGVVSTLEPFKKLQSVGLIIGEDGRKMSKRFGNIVNPDDIVKTYGADTLRIYEMFIGPFDQTVVWNTNSIIGSRRFLERVWRIGERIGPEKSFISEATLQTLLHKTIKKITEDIESMNFNTAISSMMILVNEMEKSEVSKDDFKMFLQILAPFAPHITEEIWQNLGEKKSINLSPWPKWDKTKIIDEMIKIAIQVNGKVRTEFMISKNMTEENIKNIALKNKDIITWIENKEVKRVIYVPNRVINIVI